MKKQGYFNTDHLFDMMNGRRLHIAAYEELRDNTRMMTSLYEYQFFIKQLNDKVQKKDYDLLPADGIIELQYSHKPADISWTFVFGQDDLPILEQRLKDELECLQNFERKKIEELALQTPLRR